LRDFGIEIRCRAIGGRHDRLLGMN
jgi:hypothetical protein